MSKQRTRTAQDIITSAGRWPKAAAAFAALHVALVVPAFAQSQVNDSPLGERPDTDAPVSVSFAEVQNQPGAAPAAQPAGQPAGQPAPAPAQPRDPMAAKDAKVTVSEHMTVDLHVKDEDLANVLELLSIQTQKNIIASKNVGGKVTATLYGVTFYQALDAILHVNGFGYIENGNFIYVYTNEELKAIEMAMKKRLSKVIRLNYLTAEDAKEFVSPLLSKDGGAIKINQKTKDFTINEKLPGGKDDFALGATMVIIDYEENIKAIEELVTQIDTRPAQVLVEATIMQTALNEANAFGVDFSVIGDLNFVDFINTGGPLGAANALIRGGTGGSGQGLTPPNDRGNAFTSNPGNTSGPGTFKMGVLAGDVAIFLRLLDQVTDSVILSNPKILTLNRQPSRVLVGKRVGYLNTTSTETSTTQTVNFLDTGTQLYFRPFVSDQGEVRMELKPQVSAAEIRNVTDARGAVVTIPDEVTQEIVTNVNVRDGQTVVLGGLFTESSTFTRRQVPWIGDIPILGAAFRGHDDTTQRSEIIFLVTPTIINDSHMAAAAERAAGTIEHLRTGSRQKLLPWSQDRQTDNLNVEAETLARAGETDKALWNISRSLSLNPNQPQVYQLRERLTGEKERWSDRSTLNEIVDAEIAKRIDQIQPPATPPQHRTPWGSVDQTRERTTRPNNTEPGSKNKVVTPSKSDSAPIADASEPLSSSTPTGSSLPSGTGNQPEFASPAGNAVAASTSTSGETSGTYYAQMTPVSGDSAAFNSNASTANASTAASTDSFNSSNSSTLSANSALTIESTTASTTSNTTTLDGVPTFSGVEFTSANATASPANTNPANANLTNNGVTGTQPANSAQPTAVASEVARTQVQLTALRNQILLFRAANNGAWPALGEDHDNAWKPLTDAGFIQNAPANPYVAGPHASSVLIADAPDIRFHTNYGWIYNPQTGQLWAAGFDASDKPLNKSAQPTQAQGNAASTQPTAQAPAAADLLKAISPEASPAPASSTAGVPEPKN